MKRSPVLDEVAPGILMELVPFLPIPALVGWGLHEIGKWAIPQIRRARAGDARAASAGPAPDMARRAAKR
jgi:hypothetical protein